MELLALHTRRRRRGALLPQEPGDPERVPSNMESLGLTVAIKLLPSKGVVCIYTVLAGSAGGIILVAISTLGSPEETQTLTSFQRAWWAFCYKGGKKRVCKSLETVPNESDFCHQLNDCAMDYWSMELDSEQKDTTEQFIPQTPKEKPNSMIFQNHGSKGTAQPCPRCIAGESGHFNHIMGF